MVYDSAISPAENTVAFFEDLQSQILNDHSLNADDKAELYALLPQFQVTIQYMVDHNYSNTRILQRLPRKIFSALNSVYGPLQLLVFAHTVEAKYMNEMDMENLMK